MDERKERIPKLFGSMVFNEDTMRRYVAGAAFAEWKQCMQSRTALSSSAADAIAAGMKDWALENGATHFTHWFQPLNGITAEKHDSFLTPAPGGRAIMEFSGKELVCGEPDASSFPSGGLRATFEARGYSAWDPTSYAFIKGGSLCIPTVFCSYSGEALDKKTPLLRSMECVSRQAVRILRLFGDEKASKVTAQLGPEQEYFLVDKELLQTREDLRLCGHTLFGARPPKGQELDDHYFGAIRPRVAAYMQELDEELWKLGIYAKTKHNETAPAQHEMAPVYTDANTANDQNQLVMEMMQKVADRHGLVCLLHEKPFAGINGSGKHINWSLSTDEGKNLLSPGKTPSQNAQFLLFLAAFVKGIDEYPELLRCSVAFAGNDHRLGGNEAPPAVLSIFLGDELQSVVDAIIDETDHTDRQKTAMRIGVDVLPNIPQDTTDRNRTSPIAFTGNKFEFRSPGSSQSIAGPATILNTVMAEELSLFADRLENAEDFSAALHDVIRDAFTEHRRILFSGNNYGEEWVAEAAKRGLPNLSNAAEALPTFILPKNVALMSRHGVYTETEMYARHEIHMEKYCKVLTIEANALVDMVQHSVLGAVSEYAGSLCDTLLKKKQVSPDLPCSVESSLLAAVSELNDKLLAENENLKTALAEAARLPVNAETLVFFHDRIFGTMSRVRAMIDRLETLTNSDYWPFPTYYELLSSV